ncbi:GTPase [Solibacillus isronensis]|uniref:GTPase n=1 Tax=Solibacillus isronensis TaxID=412383 RepID=UPI00203F7103|nr:GTPase [Solibacillus isronensis]MCM3720822.1 GTPase [Solibacillus isronensis]
MTIEMKNDLLNLPSLQLKMDRIVFENIDTKPNWSKAFEQLDELLHKVANNFNDYIARNNGELPSSNTYWILYMDITSKLLYFTGLAHANLIAKDDADACAHVIKLYELSASCIPNAHIESNEELLSEIEKSIHQLNEEEVKLTVADNVEQCIKAFKQFAESYEK